MTLPPTGNHGLNRKTWDSDKKDMEMIYPPQKTKKKKQNFNRKIWDKPLFIWYLTTGTGTGTGIGTGTGTGTGETR